MKISSKGRYAVRIMAELKRNSDKYISANEISSSQEISIKYTEQILSILTKSNFITSIRGVNGGYTLTKVGEECSIADILKSTGDLPELAPCLEKGYNCSRKKKCDSFKCWEKLNFLIVDYLKSVKVSDILK